MKLLVKILLFLLLPLSAYSQANVYWEEWSDNQIDSLQSAWNTVHNDTLRMAIARSLGFYYQERNRDSSLYFGEQQLSLAEKLHQTLWHADALDQVGYVLAQMKNYPRSLQCFLEGISIAETKGAEKNIWRRSIFSQAKDPRIARLTVLGYINNDVAVVYRATSNTEDALNHLFSALAVGEEIKNYGQLSMTSMGLGSAYLYDLNKPDSALVFAENALHYGDQADFHKYRGEALTIIANIYLRKGNTNLAREYFEEALLVAQQQNNGAEYGDGLLDISRLFSTSGNSDSSLWYARKGLETLQAVKDPEGVMDAYLNLASVYKTRKQLDSALEYQSMAMHSREELDNVEKINQFKNVGFSEQERLQQLEIEKAEFKNRIRTYVLLSGLAAIFIIALLLYRNNRQRKKANNLLAAQKQEIQNTLSELRSTQQQLIQSEKMASLGELTAGIAHEIQNPLNFVNNFSDVNTELIDELQGERSKVKGERNEETENEIISDIKQNLEKISHHGKRADAIVKGMLQHSRTSSGQKEPTDMNKLGDEYVRLAYQGFHARDKSFDATIITEFDPTIGSINIIPQEIGRVILNLINNAFYAVNEKKKSCELSAMSYEPLVIVQTRKLNDKIEIVVKDNGNGIPESVKGKIFQPFFTTKPTGQGTGLGLSLAYDIVKAHRGEITVETKEARPDDPVGRGEGSEFIVQIPIQ